MFQKILSFSGFYLFSHRLFSGKNKLFLTTFLTLEKHPKKYTVSGAHTHTCSVYTCRRKVWFATAFRSDDLGHERKPSKFWEAQTFSGTEKNTRVTTAVAGGAGKSFGRTGDGFVGKRLGWFGPEFCGWPAGPVGFEWWPVYYSSQKPRLSGVMITCTGTTTKGNVWPKLLLYIWV